MPQSQIEKALSLARKIGVGSAGEVARHGIHSQVLSIPGRAKVNAEYDTYYIIIIPWRQNGLRR